VVRNLYVVNHLFSKSVALFKSTAYEYRAADPFAPLCAGRPPTEFWAGIFHGLLTGYAVALTFP
jgi:hypothetical protein